MPEEITEGRAALDLAALAELAKAAAPDPMKATTMLQSIRDELELSGDVEGAGLMSQAISLVLQAAGEADAPAGDEAVDETAEVDETEVEMAEEPLDDDPAAIMAAQRATLLKSARMRMGKRLPGIVGIAKSLLQLAADAGDEASARALKAYGMDAAAKMLTEGDVAKVVDAALTKLLAPVAAGVLNNHQRLEAIERQPAAGGPLTRIAGQAITKRLGDEQLPARTVEGGAIASVIKQLRQLVAIESHPGRLAQYKEQLAQLEAAQR